MLLETESEEEAKELASKGKRRKVLPVYGVVENESGGKGAAV